MKKKIIKKDGAAVAVIRSDTPVIITPADALQLLMDIKIADMCDRIAISKSALPEEFFILSSGLAGEVLQKFVNYHSRLAIFGDFSVYTSKPLKDFIYESNKGNNIFFTATEEEAVEKLFSVK